MATPQHGAREEKKREIESQKIKKRDVLVEHLCIIDNSERMSRVLLLVFTFPLPFSRSL